MAFFSIKHEEKKIKALLVTATLANEILEIVFNEHPEIVTKAIIQTVDKNPDLFKDAKAIIQTVEKNPDLFKKGKDEND